jgi:hypothetical protein
MSRRLDTKPYTEAALGELHCYPSVVPVSEEGSILIKNGRWYDKGRVGITECKVQSIYEYTNATSNSTHDLVYPNANT